MNDRRKQLDDQIVKAFGWSDREEIEWRSPRKVDDYAEYQDESFLERLRIECPKVALHEFWPARGPCWDALAKTSSGKIILVEAKAYIEEAVDFGSKASPHSLARIQSALAKAKQAFSASPNASWSAPLYQYANRLAHLYFLRQLNGIDAYLLFVYFSGAQDVPRCTTKEQWEGAIRVIEKCLGLPSDHRFKPYVRTVFCDVADW